MKEWSYRVTSGGVWALLRDLDPYGQTQDIMLDPVSEHLHFRVASNERVASSVTAQVGMPLEIVAEVFRRAGWQVSAPKE